jgi:hypothetical protein
MTEELYKTSAWLEQEAKTASESYTPLESPPGYRGHGDMTSMSDQYAYPLGPAPSQGHGDPLDQANLDVCCSLLVIELDSNTETSSKKWSLPNDNIGSVTE